jgi:hypothetical protein
MALFLVYPYLLFKLVSHLYAAACHFAASLVHVYACMRVLLQCACSVVRALD